MSWLKYQRTTQKTSHHDQELVQLPLRKLPFSYSDKEIYYYLTDVDLFMNCGIDPINEDIRIRPENY